MDNTTMHELQQHIDYLLRHHNYVIIPGIGALVASVHSASYDSAASRLMPPQRRVAFNTAMNHNDGLLALSYSRRMLCSRREAEKILTRDLEALKQQLRAGGKLQISSAGSLYYANGQYGFESAEAGSWLPELLLTSVMQRARSEYSHRESYSRGERIATYLRRLKIAASIAVILALGFVLSTPAIQPEGGAQFASPAMEQFKPKHPQAETLLPDYTSDYNTLTLAAVSDPTAVLMADTAAISAHKLTLSQQREMASLHHSSTATSWRYCLVVASLGSRREAQDFIAANPGLDLQILESDGRYRVYALSGASIADVKARADECGLQGRFPGAWVCRK